MVLYEAQLLLEAGRPEDSLKHLQSFEQHICDPLTHWETKGNGREGERERGKEEGRDGEGREGGREGERKE